MKKKQYKNILERYLNDDWYRETLLSKWDRLAEGPTRERVATTAEREHWSNTSFLKQTTGGGAGTVATVKHPDVQRSNEWHRERVRRHRDNTPTQPQSSKWQWQDWNNWQRVNNSSSSSTRW